MPTLADPRAVLSNLIRTLIVPQLCTALDAARRPGATGAFAPTGAAGRTPAELAALLRSADVEAALRFAGAALLLCGSLGALASTLLEPTARCLGDLWSSDDCSDIDVSVGLVQLQAILHELGSKVPRHAAGAQAPSVLVVTPPGEPHQLGAAFDAEMLWHAGWNPRVDFPTTNDALVRRLGRRWVDVLDVSLSTSFRREHRLLHLGETIRRARRASLNPHLVVVVSGRVFGDPGLAAAILRAGVGADASFGSAAQAESAIRQALGRRSAAGRQPLPSVG